MANIWLNRAILAMSHIMFFTTCALRHVSLQLKSYRSSLYGQIDHCTSNGYGELVSDLYEFYVVGSDWIRRNRCEAPISINILNHGSNHG
ncbi:MAG: hypothetical protein JW395_4072 [Nitrospira sp.]|nr:hypothetical protein [Nitrospira sp.]